MSTLHVDRWGNCARCSERPATERQATEWWCVRCGVEVDLERARMWAAAVPGLEARLVEEGGPWKPTATGSEAT